MKIVSIKIDNLFEIFDYIIEYPQDENVLIITGPNGFGKTQILNIVYNLFQRNFVFFEELEFEKITISFDNNIKIEIDKEGKTPIFNFIKDKILIETITYDNEQIENLINKIKAHVPLRRIDDDLWVNRHTEIRYNKYDLISEYGFLTETNLFNNSLFTNLEETNHILNALSVHLIKEQRLFKKIDISERIRFREDKYQNIMVESIKTYAEELEDLIKRKKQDTLKETQKLESSYPKRLITSKNKLSEDDYNSKFKKLDEKQKRLMKLGLYKSSTTSLEYTEEDSKALSLYLEDLDKKLSVFDELLTKIELFTTILNERRFTFKSIKIDQEKGFYFETQKGSPLELNKLSSGEQHEVILLYELIFKTSENDLVLIDEPEISLHVTWQKEFLNDLLKIIEIQNFQVIIATHSPTIINDRWDLVYNLEKKEILV